MEFGRRRRKEELLTISRGGGVPEMLAAVVALTSLQAQTERERGEKFAEWEKQN